MANKYYLIRLFIICGIILMCSCSGENTNTEEISRIPGKFEKIDFSLDSIATDMLFVRFSNEVSLPFAQLVKWYEPYFYYSVRSFENAEIHRFTYEGKYVETLSKHGNGPDEYPGISDFFVDERTGNLYVVTNKIVVFDRNLNYLRDIKYPDSTGRHVFAKLFNNQIHLFCFSFTGKGFDWIKMDTSGKVLESRKCTESISSPNYPSDFQVFKNSTGLYRFYNRNDTIFQVDSTGYHPYRLLTREFSDGYNMVNEEWTDVFQFDGHRSNKPHRDLKSALGIGDKWILQYQKINPGGRYREMETVLFDPADNTSYLVNSVGAKFGESVYFGLNNDWVGYGTIVPSTKIEINGEKYISYVMDAIKFKKYVNSHEFASGEPKRPELKQQMQAIADNLAIDDNPVLILLKLKQ